MAVPIDNAIRLRPDGPSTRLDGVGFEIEFRGPVGSATDALMQRNVSDPTLTVFRPTNGKRNNVGVIVCPGGGWRVLMLERDGIDVASWLAEQGYTAFLLKHRVHGTPASRADYDAWEERLNSQIDLTRRGRTRFRGLGEIAPYGIFRAAREAAADDGRRAVAIVRERADEWNLSPGNVGMIGLSAGAYLAADVAVDPQAPPLAFGHMMIVSSCDQRRRVCPTGPETRTSVRARWRSRGRGIPCRRPASAT